MPPCHLTSEPTKLSPFHIATEAKTVKMPENHVCKHFKPSEAKFLEQKCIMRV